MAPSKKIIVADIGGTNFRIAISDGGTLVDAKNYLCSDFTDIRQPLYDFLSSFKNEKIYFCIAIACPVQGDSITMTNLNWSFSQKALRKEFGFEELFVINDCQAIALSIPFLTSSEKKLIGSGAKVNLTPSPKLENLPIAICAPGTGLGIAHSIFRGDQWYAFAGEGGHVDFAPNSDLEQEILKILQQKYGHVSMERILSGVGLQELYTAICQINNQIPKTLTPKQISEQAINNQCEICSRTLDQFCSILGSLAGNLALNFATLGGVYIAGGIVPKFLKFIETSQFRQRFEAKGRYQHYNMAIPTYVVITEYPGLKGAEIYLQSKIG